MSEVSRGQGWWLASDGKWYPPELHPAYASLPAQPLGLDRDSVLATDEDREVATASLREGFASGQLTAEEHEARISAALGARSLEELDRATVGLQRSVIPRRKRLRIQVLLGVGVLLVGGAAGIAAAVSGGGAVHPSATPTTGRTTSPSPEAGLALPPKSPSLNKAEFSLAPLPKANFLGNAVVFTASAAGSQTSPSFKLNGAVMIGSVGQDGHGAFYFLVPAGGTFDPAQPVASPTSPGEQSWGGGPTPAAGTYRLQVMAAAATHWNMTLKQFWVPPTGVTVAASSTVKNLGQPVVVASGTTNMKSALFTWPADPVGTNQFGGYDMVFACMSGWASVTSAFLAKAGGPTFSLPLSGNPQISVPGPGRYRLIVAATGPWAIAFEYGSTLSWSREAVLPRQ
jgi:hypothetical protein